MSNAAIGTAPPRTAVRPAPTAALIAGVALVIKVVVILATNNTAPEMLTTVLYALGMLLPIVAAVAIGRRRHSLGAKIGVAAGIVVAHLFYVTMLSDAVEALVAPFTDTPYVLDEVPVAVLGVIWIVVGLQLLRSERQ